MQTVSRAGHASCSSSGSSSEVFDRDICIETGIFLIQRLARSLAGALLTAPDQAAFSVFCLAGFGKMQPSRDRMHRIEQIFVDAVHGLLG